MKILNILENKLEQFIKKTIQTEAKETTNLDESESLLDQTFSNPSVGFPCEFFLIFWKKSKWIEVTYNDTM